jgi:hypothetical protein
MTHTPLDGVVIDPRATYGAPARRGVRRTGAEC